MNDRIKVDFSDNLLLDKYTVSLWLKPNRNSGQDFTGVFGRNGRSYVIFLGEFLIIRHLLSFIIDLERAFNDNQGVRDYTLSGWNKWYHIVCSNGGIGELARTYINGKFVQSNIRYERRIVSELIQNSGSILNIGADYGSNANNSWNHYLGIIDDIRLYNKPFGMEDVYHLYKGDPSLVTYRAPTFESLNGQLGHYSKCSPLLL